MRTTRLRSGVACMVIAVLTCPAFGQVAGGIPIAVAPVIVKMNLLEEFSSIEVSNRGGRPTSVEIEVVRVSWAEGREKYEPTTDFTLSPPVFRMQAGKSRTVRFKYDAQRHETEGFYRLFVHQLPEEISGNQVNLVFKLGVPIFVAPLTSQPALSLHPATIQGRLSELHNTGNVTLTVVELEGQGCPTGPQKVMVRLSPSQKSVLRDVATACITSARTDQGVIQLTTK